MDNKQSEQGTPRARRSSCIAGGRRISLGMRKNEPISANNSVKTDKYFRDSDGTEEDPTQIILCGATDSEGEEDGYTTCLQPQEETVFGTAIFEEDEELLIREDCDSITWKLDRFKDNIATYLDNESKYLDENEIVPLRVGLISTGIKIKLPCKFLGKLYLSQLAEEVDENENKKATTSRAPGAETKHPVNSKAWLEVQVKLVEFCNDDLLQMHFSVQLLSTSGRDVVKMINFQSHIKNGGSTSVCTELNAKDHLAKLSSDDGLLVILKCHVYRPQWEWGLAPDELYFLNGLMKAGEAEKGQVKKMLELAEKCKTLLGLEGIHECLNHIMVPKFFE